MGFKSLSLNVLLQRLSGNHVLLSVCLKVIVGRYVTTIHIHTYYGGGDGQRTKSSDHYFFRNAQKSLVLDTFYFGSI